MSPTGNKCVQSGFTPLENNRSNVQAIFKWSNIFYIFNRSKCLNIRSLTGFTLIEILITVSIISLATVFIVQSNLINLAAFGRYENRLDVQQWSLEKIAETKKTILESEAPETGSSSGSLSGKSRPYEWKLEVNKEQTKFGNVYFVNLRVSWLEGSREAILERHSGILKIQR